MEKIIGAYEIYRRLLLKTEMQFLKRPHKHSEAFVRGAFRNLKDGFDILQREVVIHTEGK